RSGQPRLAIPIFVISSSMKVAANWQIRFQPGLLLTKRGSRHILLQPEFSQSAHHRLCAWIRSTENNCQELGCRVTKQWAHRQQRQCEPARCRSKRILPGAPEPRRGVVSSTDPGRLVTPARE